MADLWCDYCGLNLAGTLRTSITGPKNFTICELCLRGIDPKTTTRDFNTSCLFCDRVQGEVYRIFRATICTACVAKSLGTLEPPPQPRVCLGCGLDAHRLADKLCMTCHTERAQDPRGWARKHPMERCRVCGQPSNVMVNGLCFKCCLEDQAHKTYRGETYGVKDEWCFVLGLEANFTEVELKRAYRRCAKAAHPDKPGGSTERMQKVNAAYEAAKRVKGL